MVICGLVGYGTEAGALPHLDAVLAGLDPYGERCSTAAIDATGLVAAVAGRWGGKAAPPLARCLRSPDDPATVVVADVRLDHPGRLASELGLTSSATAPELVLGAYRRWGDDCCRYLHGDFAFAVVDARRPGVLLAVDHAGHCPLAVYERGGLVAFASTALALTALDAVGHELDLERATEVVALARSDRTFVRGVRMMGPGSALRVDPTGTRRWRWWEPEKIAIRDRGSLDSHAEELRGLLDDAVAGAVDDTDRIGVSLSGGLDSTSVAAAAARLRAPERIASYTSVPPPGWTGPPRAPRDPDESPLVHALAARYPNLATRFVDVAGRAVLEGHEPFWELGAPPMRNAMNAMWIHAIGEEASADGVQVLLTGAAGNGAFSADGPRVLVELARRGRLARMSAEARARAARTGRPLRRVLRSDLVALGAPTRLRRWRADRRGSPDPVTEWLGATALRAERAEELDLVGLMPLLAEPDTTRWTRSPVEIFAGLAAQGPQGLATRAWWGYDPRDPTANRRLVEAALAQPEWWRRHQGVDRAIARAAMADRLPPEIVERSRRGAQLPDWFARLDDDRAAIEGELEAARDHPPTREVIDVERLTALVRGWPAPQAVHTRAATWDYRLALARALLVSRYLRWFEGRARRVAAGGPAVVLPLR